MTTLSTELESLASDITRARLQGHAMDAPARIPTLEEAYAVSGRVATLMDSPRVGYKVGSTSAEAQARLGTDQPGTGAVLKRFTYAHDDDVPVSPRHDVQVEVEFAVRIAATPSPRATPWTAETVRELVDAVVPAMELVGSRFTQGLAGAGRALVTADCGANIALVLGAPVALSSDADLAAAPCALEVNGERVAEGTGARALGDPFNVLAWLANHLAADGRSLEAGEVVSTGTCTGLVHVSPGDRLTADFGPLGQVSCTLTELRPED